jgi:hypothetical protein
LKEHQFRQPALIADLKTRAFRAIRELEKDSRKDFEAVKNIVSKLKSATQKG